MCVCVCVCCSCVIHTSAQAQTYRKQKVERESSVVFVKFRHFFAGFLVLLHIARRRRSKVWLIQRSFFTDTFTHTHTYTHRPYKHPTHTHTQTIQASHTHAYTDTLAHSHVQVRWPEEHDGHACHSAQNVGKGREEGNRVGHEVRHAQHADVDHGPVTLAGTVVGAYVCVYLCVCVVSVCVSWVVCVRVHKCIEQPY
jgi:hypothetical protein